MHEMYFDHIYPLPPYNSSQIHPIQNAQHHILCPTLSPPPLSSVCASHILIGVGPSTRTCLNHAPWKRIGSPQDTINWLCSMSTDGSLRAPLQSSADLDKELSCGIHLWSWMYPWGHDSSYLTRVGPGPASDALPGGSPGKLKPRGFLWAVPRRAEFLHVSEINCGNKEMVGNTNLLLKPFINCL